MSSIFQKLKESAVFRHSLGYTFLNFVEKFLPFLVLPILTRVLSKEEVGIFVLYQTLVEVLMPVVTFSIDNSILINYYKLKKSEFSVYFSNSFWLVLILFLAIVLIIFLFSDTIGSTISFPGNWLVVVCSLVLFRYLTNLRQSIWRLQYKIRSYGMFTIAISLLGNLSGLFLVIFTDIGWEGILLGHLLGYVLFGTISVLSFRREKLLQFNSSIIYVKDIFAISLPIALHRLGIWLGSAANKIIISSLLGVAATGSFGVGMTLATLVTVLEDAFSKAVVPHIYDKLKNPNNENNRSIVKMSYRIYLVLFIVSGIVFIVGYFGVEYLFGREYGDVKYFLAPLIIAAMFKGFYKLHVNYIFFTAKTLEVTKITVFTGVMNCILSYIFIQNYGIAGACYSLLIINFIQYLLSFYVGNKLIPMPWY